MLAPKHKRSRMREGPIIKNKRDKPACAGINCNTGRPTDMRKAIEKPKNIKPVLGVFKKGGQVKKTGNYKLHKGETVLTAAQTKSLKKVLNK